MFEELHAKGVREQCSERSRLRGVAFSGIKNQHIIIAEFAERLAACAAWHGSGVIEVRHGYGAQTNRRSMLGNSARDRRLLGAARKPVRTVLDVASRNDRPTLKQQRGSDTEMAVRRVRIFRGCPGEIAKLLLCGGRRRISFSRRRHVSCSD